MAAEVEQVLLVVREVKTTITAYSLFSVSLYSSPAMLH